MLRIIQAPFDNLNNHLTIPPKNYLRYNTDKKALEATVGLTLLNITKNLDFVRNLLKHKTDIKNKMPENRERTIAESKKRKKGKDDGRIKKDTFEDLPTRSEFRNKTGLPLRFRPSLMKRMDKLLDRSHKEDKNKLARYATALQLMDLTKKIMENSKINDKRKKGVKDIQTKLIPLIENYKENLGIDYEKTRDIYGKEEAENRENSEIVLHRPKL